MIRFSRREDYAIVIVGTLAQAYKKHPVSISQIAKDYAISSLFLRNLANELREAGIIKAIEGKNGGYYLTKDPKDLKMGNILGIFSKKQHATCCSVSRGNNTRVCPKESTCIAGNTWRQLNNEFLDKVYNLSLQAFLEYK